MRIKEIISRVNLPARASMGYLGASLVGKAVGFLTTPFFTRLISKEEYGALTLYMTVLGGASVICSAFSSGSAAYRGFKKYEGKIGGYLKSSLVVSLCFSLLICILLFTFMPFIGLDRVFFVPLALQILCDTAISVSLAYSRFRYKYAEVMAVGILSSVLPALASLMILTKFGCGCGVRIYSLLAISLISAVAAIIRIFRRPGRADRKMVRYNLSSSLPLLPHSLSVALSGQADKLIITSLMGAAALAKYSVAHSLGIALQFAVTALGSALGPWIIRRLDSGESGRISEILMPIFSLFCALSLGICALAPEAMGILAPIEYFDATPSIIPIALSIPLSLLSYAVTVSLVHAEKGRYTAVISIINLGLCVILNYTLIPRLGYIGAGLSLLLSQLTAVLIGVALLSRVKLSEIIPLRTAGRYFLVSCGLGLLADYLYGSLALRVLLLTIPAAFGLRGLFACARLIREK